MCKLKYKLHYIDGKWPEERLTDDVMFGRLVHKAFEIYNPEQDNKEEIVKLVRDYPILSSEYKRLLGPTYKSLFEFYSKYGDKPSEEELDLSFKYDDFIIRGYVDRLIEGDNFFICVDYKTSRYATMKYHVFQLKFYNLLVSKNYEINPSKIRMMLYFPRPNQEEKTMFSKNEINLFEKELRQKVNDIETNTEWPATPGKHCRWCPFFNTPDCPATYEDREIIS